MPDFSTEINTIVIGAGPAGLAVGACLKRAGVESIILEQSDQVGSAWRRHYDRLHLHTDKKNSELPFTHFPINYPRYPSRDQLIDYLESYAKKFDLGIRFGQQVSAARREGNRWAVETQNRLYHSSNLVIAAVNTSQPNIPQINTADLFKGNVIHSSAYAHGEQLRSPQGLDVALSN